MRIELGINMNKPNTKIIVFNLSLIVLLIVAFASLFTFIVEFIYFTAYFLMLTLVGLGFLSNFKSPTNNSVIYLILSLIVGISLNQVLFLFLGLLKINTIYSLVILTVCSSIFVVINLTRTKIRLSNVKILQEKQLWMLILLIFISIFILSDGITYTHKGVFIQDTVNPTDELSKSGSLKTGFPVQNHLYSGTELKWHFGYGMILHQLTNNLKIDGLPLIHLIMPIFLLALIFLLLYSIPAPSFKPKLKIVLCILMIFSTLSISLTKIILIINNLFGLKINDPLVEPHFLFYDIAFMGSHGLGILMIIALCILIATKKMNYALEIVLLTGLALTKSTFFLPICGAYSLLYLIKSIKDRKLHVLIKGVTLVLPGCLYFFLFIMGTYQENLWALFPGYLNIQTTNFTPGKLIINTIFSPFITLLAHLGVGLIFFYAKLRDVVRKKFWIEQIKKDTPFLFFFFTVLISYILGNFLIEVTELNNEAFLIPGYTILSLFTYNHLINSKRKLIAVLLVFLLIINLFTFLSFSYIIPSMTQINDNDQYINNNVFANLKIVLINRLKECLPEIKFVPSCFMSHDFLNGMKKLSEEPEGIFVFNILHHDCENTDNTSSWNRRSHFLRTALSGKQAVIEEYKYHGIMAQPDYCDRAFDNIIFYASITGKLNEIKKMDPSFFLQQPAKYNNLSYYPYFRLFSENNYYTYNEQIFACLSNKFKNIDQINPDKKFLKEYIVKNNITYIVFERNNKPLEKYAKDLHLQKIYSSEKVKIFKVKPINMSSPSLLSSIWPNQLSS